MSKAHTNCLLVTLLPIIWANVGVGNVILGLVIIVVSLIMMIVIYDANLRILLGAQHPAEVKVEATRFTPPLIRNAVRVAKAAYCVREEQEKIFSQTIAGVPCVKSFSCQSPKGFASQAYNIVFFDDYIIVGFRGTNDVKDWCTNCNPIPGNLFDGKIHGGFLQRAKSIPLDEILELARNKKLIFTGHSLGGAIAKICTLLCFYKTTDTPNVLQNIFCITFGAPYVGTAEVKDFVATFRKDFCLANNILNIVNENDCIPGILNLGVSAPVAMEILNKIADPFCQILSWVSTPIVAGGVGVIIDTIRKAITELPDLIPTYQPIGSYQFVDRVERNAQRHLELSRFYGIKDYKYIQDRLSNSVKANAAYIEQHRLDRYEHSLCALLGLERSDEAPSEVATLPPISQICDAIQESRTLPAHLQQYTSYAINSLDRAGLTLIVRVNVREEFQRLSKVLFKLNVARVLCFISHHEFLVEQFYDSFHHVELREYHESHFELNSLRVIRAYEHAFPVSPDAKPLFPQGFIKLNIFTANTQAQFPKSINLHSMETIEGKWTEQWEAAYLRSQIAPAPVPGGFVVNYCRNKTSRELVQRCLLRWRTRFLIKKQRLENAKAIAERTPSSFVLMTASRKFQEILASTGNMKIILRNETMTVSQLCEVIARRVSEDLSSLSLQHEEAMANLRSAQQRELQSLLDGFSKKHKGVSAQTVRQLKQVVNSLRQRIEDIFNANITNREYWSRFECIEQAMAEHGDSLAQISQDYQDKLEKVVRESRQQMDTLKTAQLSEIEQLKTGLEADRVQLLQDNRLSYVGEAAVWGGLVGGVISLFVTTWTESFKIYYERKPINKAAYDIVKSTAQGAALGAISSGIVTYVETTAEILPANSFMRAMLKGNGGIILAVGFFSIGLIGAILQYRRGELTLPQLQAALTTQTTMFAGTLAGGALANALVAFLGASNPFILGAAVLVGSLLGGYAGRKAGEFIDQKWIKSEEEPVRAAYAALGVKAEDSLSKINRQYHILSRRFHPDKVDPKLPEQDKKAAHVRFLEISVAIELIRAHRIDEQQAAAAANLD
eukprot:gene26568-32109_t